MSKEYMGRQPLLAKRRAYRVTSANLYIDDLDFLKENNIPMARALRIALGEYIATMRGTCLMKQRDKLRKEDREAFIIRGMLPNGTRVPEPVDNKPVAEVLWCTAVPTVAHEPVPDMTGWTKEERDSWIMTGRLPDRAMTAQARARGFSTFKATTPEDQKGGGASCA